MTKPQVGWWASFCCELDLQQIRDEKDLQEYLELDKENASDGISPHQYWPSKEAALKDLLAKRHIELKAGKE